MTASGSNRRWPRVPGIAFGGDYNPEQWPEDIWAEDIALMGEAGVSMVTVGVFSWALLEPAQGSYDFGWLDRVMDLLAAAHIGVDLATATASPPPWFSHRYPESLPVTREGHRLWQGARQAYCPSSTAYRAASTALAGALATRYATHPALVMWHVNNEYGCHVAECFCDVSAAAFRRWLRERYGDLDRAERGVGYCVLEPALLRLGRGRSAAADADLGQPDAEPRLEAILQRRAARLLHRRARRAPRHHPRAPGHDQLHGRIQAGRLLQLGPARGHRFRRPLHPGLPTPPTTYVSRCLPI